MLEKLLLPENHAIAILIKDHDRVKNLFDRFERSHSAAEQEKIISQALIELKVHAEIEEEIFYPAVRKQVGNELMNEADEEHHVARVLIAELDQKGLRDDHRHAKFTVLSESVRHHIKEEESEMLPKAKRLDLDFEALGQQMLQRKNDLKRNGIPDDAEHAMVAGVNGRGDSPAARARGGTSRIRNKRKRTATDSGKGLGKSVSANSSKRSRRQKNRTDRAA